MGNGGCDCGRECERRRDQPPIPYSRGRHSIPELRNLVWRRQNEPTKHPFLKPPENDELDAVVVAGSIGAIVTAGLLANFDYNSDAVLSRTELLGDTDFAILVSELEKQRKRLPHGVLEALWKWKRETLGTGSRDRQGEVQRSATGRKAQARNWRNWPSSVPKCHKPNSVAIYDKEEPRQSNVGKKTHRRSGKGCWSSVPKCRNPRSVVICSRIRVPQANVSQLQIDKPPVGDQSSSL